MGNLNPDRKYSLLIDPKEYEPNEEPAGIDLTSLADHYKTDKGTIKHNYTQVYEKLLSGRKQDNIDLLEIGVACGSSLKMWSSYFENGNITGLDIRPECAGLCADFPKVDIVIADATAYKPEKSYDFIIDDGSHVSIDIVNTWKNLWQHIKPGGIYFIEDLRCTHNPAYMTMYDWKRPQEDFNRKHVIDWLNRLMMLTDLRQTNIESIHYTREMLAIGKKK